MTPSVRLTLRLPKPLSARLDKHVLRAKRTSVRYSKNDAVVRAVQHLLDSPSETTDEFPENFFPGIEKVFILNPEFEKKLKRSRVSK